MIKNLHKIKECPDCASSNIIYIDDKMQVICNDCGLIYEPLEPKTEEKFEKTHGIKVSAKKPKSKKR